MHHIKKSIHAHIELFAIIIFLIISVTILSITLFLINQNQDTRSRAASGTCTVDNAITLDTQEQEFLNILNNHRASIGRGPLRASLNLSKAAQWQTEDMIENNYRSHTDSLGRSAQQRLNQCGIGGSTGGENIVWARTSAQHAFDGWMSSPGHKANMEHAAYTQIGIARMSEGNNKSVWVNTFSSGNDGTSPELDLPTTPSSTPVPPSTTPTISPTAQPTSQPSPSVTPIEPTLGAGMKSISYSFKIIGIGNNTTLGENNNPIHSNLIIQIFIYGESAIRLAQTTYNPNLGIYEGRLVISEGQLETDNKLVFSISSSLLIAVQLNQIQNYTIPQFTAITGDFNNDLEIDINDYIDLVACIKNIRCTPDETTLDLNDDGEIGSVDLNIILNRFYQLYR